MDTDPKAEVVKTGPFQQEGYAFMGAVYEVHNQQGGGLLEEVYQECLEIELELRGIPFQSKQPVATYYKGRTLQKRYVPDLVVFGGIIAELKAVAALLPEHEAQLLNYLKLSKVRVGYLVNFPPKGSVQWRRLVL